MIEIFLLSLIQGITEFLPISSSSHLIIFSNFTNFENQSLAIDVSLHVGSFLAVLTYFTKDIINFIKNKVLFLKIFIASLPVMFVGFILVQTNLIQKIRNIEIIGWTTLIFGILLYISDKYKLEKNIDKNFNYKSALIIGLFQILSLIPGVSRSGISITAARFLNFNRFDAVKISFLLSIPTLGAVSIFGLTNLISSKDFSFSLLNLISIFFSFIFSLITINYFLKYIKKSNLYIFVVYRISLGLLLLAVAYL
jgi:undecaprenyl-diphosphatase